MPNELARLAGRFSCSRVDPLRTDIAAEAAIRAGFFSR